MKRATIADVAAHVGVSKSTVSHALSGKRPISGKTRERIQQAIKELGYQPHPVAQRLAGGRSQTIGFVYPLYAPSIAGLEMKFIASAANVINQTDYAFLLLTHPHHESHHLQRFVQSGLVDGFILMQVQLEDPRVEMLRHAGLPFVLIGRCTDNTGLTYIDVDIDGAISECVDYLVGLGHRSIAYLHQDDPDFGFFVRAQRGFVNVCQRHNLSPMMQPCELSAESGQMATNDLLDRHPETTAVIVWNDSATWGVVQAAQARGLDIPKDLSVISFDHSTITKLVPFSPTTIDIRAEKTASRAAQMLIALLEDDPHPRSHVLIEHKFIIGDSTASP